MSLLKFMMNLTDHISKIIKIDDEIKSGSMPLSRKSIFVTNTIGGIVVLILLQAITPVM